jgi:hypothetical protein
MLRCNHYLEPSPQGASERKIPICLVNSVFNSRGRAPARNRRGKERQWDLPIALQIKRGRFESAPELAAPATTIGSIWVGSIHRRGRRQRQIATQASACCCHHKVPAFTNAQRPPHQFSRQKRYRQSATSTIQPKRKRSKNRRRWWRNHAQHIRVKYVRRSSNEVRAKTDSCAEALGTGRPVGELRQAALAPRSGQSFCALSCLVIRGVTFV